MREFSLADFAIMGFNFNFSIEFISNMDMSILHHLVCWKFAFIPIFVFYAYILLSITTVFLILFCRDYLGLL